MWDRTIFSVIKPSYCFMIDEDLHRFTQIWEQNWFCYCFWTILQAVHLKLFRSNNKNNFTLKWWLKYRNNRSVSWRLSCNCLMKKKITIFLKIYLLSFFHFELHSFQMFSGHFSTLASWLSGLLDWKEHGTKLSQPIAVHTCYAL